MSSLAPHRALRGSVIAAQFGPTSEGGAARSGTARFEPSGDRFGVRLRESGLPIAAVSNEVPDLDIVLSAGPMGTPFAPDHSCDPGNQQACSLYRVIIRSGNAVVQRVRNAGLATGFIEPSISPDQDRVAYVTRGEAPDGNARTKALVVTDFATGAHATVWQPNGPYRGPQWPDWADNDTLLFDSHTNDGSHPDHQDHRVLAVPAGGGVASSLLPGVEVSLGGAEVTEVGSGWWWSDVDVYRPGNPSELAVVAQRQELKKPPWPHVMRWRRGWPFGDLRFESEEPFGTVDVPTKNQLLIECHHPTWAPSGKAVACMGHSPVLPAGGLNYRPLYRFDRGGSSWSSDPDEPLLFEPHSASELAAAFADMPDSRIANVSGGDYVTYKYPAWIRRDWVVVTLYVQDESSAVVGSRTVLVRISTREIVDLTRLVEKAEGRRSGTLRGFTGTALKARQDDFNLAPNTGVPIGLGSA